MFNVPSQFAGSLPFGMFSSQEVPFGLATLQADPNCVLIQDPSQVWGVQDFPPSSYSSDDKLAWGATKNVDWVQRNALLYTDDLTNAAWTKSSTSAPSAGVLQCSAATATHEFRSTTGPITPVVGQTYYLSCKAKQGTSPYVQLACFSGMHGTAYANFDLSTGAVGTSTACTPTIAGPDGDGYYTVTIAVVATGTPAASGFRLSIQQSASDARQQSWAAAGTETVNVKNMGLYVGSLPSYQAIGADWDTTYTAAAIAAGYPISLWTDSAGTKAVNSDNQPIGACRDLKYGDYGPNKVVNGTFDSNADSWVNEGATSIGQENGTLKIVASGSGQGASQQFSDLVVGRTYLLTAYIWTVGGISASLRMLNSSRSGFVYTGADITSAAPTLATAVYRPTQTNEWIYIRSGAAGTVYADNISVREIPGYTAIQATTANQPKWRLDANGKGYIERDLTNDSLPITLPTVLSDSQLGPELATGIDISSPGWASLGTISNITSNSFTTSGSGGRNNQSLLSPGRYYRVSVTFSKATSAAFSFRLEQSGVDVASSTALSGTLSAVGSTGAADELYFRLSASDTVTITNISVREVTGTNVVYTAEGNVTLKDSGLILSGSYAPITPAVDYGRIIMAADSRYDAKIVKYLDQKRGR